MNKDELKQCQAAIHELIEDQDYENALPVIYSVLENYPNDAATLHFLGYIWLVTGKEAFAYQLVRRALQEAPNNHAIWVTFGRAAHELGLYSEALNCFMKAAEINPDYALAYSNASATLVQLSDWDAVIKTANMALECNPNDLNAQLNISHAYLARGQWRDGWKHWGKSLGCKFRKEWTYGHEPRWDGSHGKNIVVYGEQGLGDEIFYASCLNDAITVSESVIIDCDPKLEGLFKRSFPDAQVYGTRREIYPDWVEDAKIDARCAIGGLPEFFRNKDKDFPKKAYLVADPERRIMWRALFDSWGKKVLGFTTHGGTKLTNEKGRKLTHEDLSAIFGLDYEFVCLDYKVESKIVGVHYFPFCTESSDYDDTAALISELDVVVGVNTTALHCAAAMGVKTICLVPKYHQWRYAYPSMLWYPTMRLVHQDDKTWEDTIKYVAKNIL
jgi:tetratricopeptide (TPR) repeat protein